jgi:hypothetical protein
MPIGMSTCPHGSLSTVTPRRADGCVLLCGLMRWRRATTVVAMPKTENAVHQFCSPAKPSLNLWNRGRTTPSVQQKRKYPSVTYGINMTVTFILKAALYLWKYNYIARGSTICALHLILVQWLQEVHRDGIVTYFASAKINVTRKLHGFCLHTFYLPLISNMSVLTRLHVPIVKRSHSCQRILQKCKLHE